MGNHGLGLDLVRQRRRHITDLEAARFLVPAQQPLIGGASRIGLDGELGDNIRCDLILLGKTQEPVDRHRVPAAIRAIVSVRVILRLRQIEVGTRWTGPGRPEKRTASVEARTLYERQQPLTEDV